MDANAVQDAARKSAATLSVRNFKLPHSNGYYESLPEGYGSEMSTKYPLLLFFHGAGELGNGSGDINKLLSYGPLSMVSNKTFPASFTVNRQKYSFIILSVQFTQYGIYPDEIDAFIEYAKQHYPVDISRIYLTGLSMGGAECWNYAGSGIDRAKKIAAMVPVAAHIDEKEADHNINAAKTQIIASSNLPIWSTHNSGDPTSMASWVINAHELLSNLNPRPDPLPRLTLFNSDLHEGWTQTYSPSFRENGMNIYEWMLQYHR